MTFARRLSKLAATLDSGGKVPASQLIGVGGDFCNVQTITVANGASYIDVSLDPAIYKSMLLSVFDLYGSVSSGLLALQFLSSENTPSISAAHKYSYSSAGSSTITAATSQSAITLPCGWGSSSSFKLTAEINVPISTSNNNNARLSWEASDKWVERDTMGVAGIHGAWSKVVGVRLFPSSGTFTAGTIIVYGVKK